ncbi:division/cell wall cluster transcriptional repressor MraZ [bacterium]|nr:division/cell wall cluster transcriptional repressor MraZ [bacterium]
MSLFTGFFVHNMDDKGRLILPAKLRLSLGVRFYLTRGIGGCVFLFSEDHWRSLVEKLTRFSFFDKNAVLLQRLLVGGAEEASCDKQGRLAIPLSLREYAGLKENDDVVIMGMGDRIEIWSKERWNKFEEELTPEEIAKAAEKLGFLETSPEL